MVFTNTTNVAEAKLLRKGYRHCYLILEGNRGLKIIKPLRTQLHVGTMVDTPLDAVVDHLRGRGDRVVVTRRRGKNATAAKWPHTCVTVAKRMLHIQDAMIQTPAQLYAALSEGRGPHVII